MNELGQLPFYLGIVVHDCLRSYFKADYVFTHALCNAHLLRECKGIAEQDHHAWTPRMMELLQEAWQLAKDFRQREEAIPAEVIEAIGAHYDAILEDGQAEWAQAPGEKTGTPFPRTSFFEMPFYIQKISRIASY